MVAFARRRGLVFNDRSTPYTALLNGCIARRARFTDLGVTALFTARAGCIARRTPRGMNIRENKPTVQMVAARVIGVKLACSPRHPPSTGTDPPTVLAGERRTRRADQGRSGVSAGGASGLAGHVLADAR